MSSDARQNVEAIYPLTPLQQGMLFHTIYAPQSGVYFQQLSCTLTGKLDAAALENAWQRVVERHPILRTGFAWEGQPKPLQFVRRHVKLPWEQQDWRGLSTGEQDERLETYIRHDRERGFKLSKPPLTRCLLARKRADEHEFVWSYHHILLDGWSIALLLKEVFAYYEAFRARQDAQIASPRPYQDYLNWLKRQNLAEAETYWRQSLRGFGAPTTLNPARGRSRTEENRDSEYGESQIHLAATPTANLQAAARRHGLTMNTLVQGMWGLLLSRYSDSPDVVFGTVVSGRPESLSGIESMIGLFVNTLPVRIRTHDDGEPLLKWLQRLQRQQAESRQYAYSPLVDVQGWSEVPRDQPLFDYIYGFENYPIEKVAGEQGGSIRVGNVRFVEQTNYLLNLMVWESDELLLKLTHARDHFDQATGDRMLGNLRTLLEGVVTHLEQPLSALPWLTTGEREQLLVEWNETARAHENDACIHELFEAQARHTPDAVAVVCGNEQLTYGELNRRANKLGHYLRQLGVVPEALVGLCVERSVEMLVGLLGILKAGGAYVPLDPSYPQVRIAQMLEDAAVKVLVTQQRLVERLPAHDARMICLDGEREELERQSTGNCESGATADNLAYVIYTSGSTGRPKGVMSVHRAALNRFNWMWETFPFGADEVCCQKTSLSFVDSVWEIFGPLLRGVKNVVISDEHVRDPHRLIEQLAAGRVSRIVVVPSLLHAILESNQDLRSKLARLRYWVSSGEALPSELCARFKDRLPESRLINLYGSSEVSADVSCYETRPHQLEQSVPIGKPISNMRLYVLNTRLQPVPVGVAGHLYAGGVGLARGYHRRSDQTAERFIPDPFAAGAGARLYRTGDIARYTATGELEYVGRADYQVKLRGYRIELGEIEAQLRGHEGVKECVVVVRGAEAGGSGGTEDRRLVAYVVAVDENSEGVNGQALRAYLLERLPEYMVPAAFVRLAEMPLTPNGKLDRNALPAPELSSLTAEREFESPRTPVEEVVAGIWAELLGAERVSIDDNFFELGGHSLLAMQVVSRVREACGVEVAVRRMFERPTVRGLAAEVEAGLRGAGAPGEADEVRVVERGGELPLSFAQQRLWLADQLEVSSPHYNVPAAIRLTGTLDAKALEQSLSEIVRRHEVLRTSFATVKGRPVQVIVPASPLVIPQTDLSQLGEAGREAEVFRLAREEAQRPFDLSQPQLLRVALLRLAEAEHVVLLTMHHIVSDGWSLGVLVREVGALYESFANKLPAPLPELPIQYADFAVWQRAWLEGTEGARQLTYWKKQLAGAPDVLTLPTDRPRPPLQSFRGTVETFTLAPALGDALKAFSLKEGATLFMTLLSAFDALLYLYTKQETILVGTDIANRNRGELEKLIGFFVNQLVLRADMSGNPTFRELLRRVKEVSLGAYAHQDMPFDKLVEELNPKRDLNRPVLFQVKMVFQNVPIPPLKLSRLELAPLEIAPQTAKYDLLLDVGESDEGLRGAMHYSTELFDAKTIARMLKHYEAILRHATTDADARLHELDEVLRVADEQERATEEQLYEQARRSKLKNIKRRVVV